MSAVNPYEAPQASLERPDADVGYDETSPFSPAGRFGRASYIAYVFGMYFALMLCAGIFMGIATALGDIGSLIGGALSIIVYVAFFVMAIIFMIRRLHDLNWSGWLSALTVVPIVNIIIAIPCLFFRGTAGANNYGPPPKPNRTHTIVAAVSILLVVGVGILAAVAIPAYQEYLQRASEVSQGMNQ